MNYVVFDLETQNLFEEVGSNNSVELDISVATFYEGDTDIYTTVHIDDLQSVWPILERADALVTYNGDNFDIPLLNKYYHGDLTQIKSIDILASIRSSLGRRIKLDSVASATLNTKKSADGLQAVRWWREGKIKEIMKYCEQDVKVTKKLFDFALINGFVKFKDGYRKEKIPLDTSSWETKDDTCITHSLLF